MAIEKEFNCKKCGNTYKEMFGNAVFFGLGCPICRIKILTKSINKEEENMTKNISEDVELLAPVPSCILDSAVETLKSQQGVLFGSAAFLVFHQLDEMRDEDFVRVWIYASQEGGVPIVSWKGIYSRFISSSDPSMRSMKQMRPKNTQDEKGWAIFWKLVELEKLSPDQQFPIKELFGIERKTSFKKNFIPKGPILIKPKF